MNLAGNNLHSVIPDNLHTVSVLNFANNPRLNGTIPNTFWNSTLTDLTLSDCNLEGTLPERLGPALAFAALDGNSLTGTLPAAFGSLQTLDLSRNQLRGTLPDFSTESRLTRFRIGSNGLEGSIPYTLITTQRRGLIELDLSNNNFHGNLPPFPAIAGPLSFLSIARNNLTGPLNAILLNLPVQSLRVLDVSGNSGISGTIPTGLGLFRSLTFLRLDSMALTGTIPTEIGNLVSLRSCEFRIGCANTNPCLFHSSLTHSLGCPQLFC